MPTVRNTLFSLHLSKFTGKVEFQMDQVRKSIFFKGGNPIYVDSTIRSETLGQMLLGQGKMTTEQYQSVLKRMQESGKRQGEVIVELGLLSGFEVYQALQDQASQKIQNSFLLEGATITKDEGEEHLKGVPELQIDFFRVIIDAFYGMIISAEDEPNYPENKTLKLNKQGYLYLEGRSLQPHETKMIRLLGGKHTHAQILEAMGGHQDDGEMFLKAMSFMNFIEFTKPPPKKFQIKAPKEEPKPERKVVEVKQEAPPKSPIYALALKIDRPYHELLGLGLDANTFQYRRNYDSILRKFKLDTIDDTYGGKERDLANAILDRLTVAVTILCDDKRRHKYVTEFKKTRQVKADPDPAVQAEVCAQKGRMHLAHRKFDEAEELFRKAIELDPKESGYHVDLADLIIQKAAAIKAEYPDEIEKELREALKLNSSNEQAFFHLGNLLKLKGEMEKARNYFLRCVDLKPNHPKANAELRLINRRLEGARKGQSALLSLFKKK